MAKLTQSELERHLWQAADILRGHVDAGKFKDYIFGLLFYRRLCDVWDEEFEALLAETGDREEAADPDEHRFNVPAEHRWDQVRKQSTQIGQRLNNAFAAIEDANLRLRGVFGDIDFANQERFPDARLESLLAHFEKHPMRNADVPADMLGDAYMYLIKMFAEGAGKAGGEFYTPRQVVRLIVECLDPQPGMSIYDPTCGSGGMLLEAVQHLKERGQAPRSLSLFGQEKELDTWSIAEINLFLHDIDDAFIAKGDTILAPKRYDPKTKEFVAGVGEYDRVMANPPFSQKVWGHEVWSNGDPFGRDKYGYPPKGYGDLAFVQHMIASLKDDGMLGVVVPYGVLFRGAAEGRIREGMLRADIIEAVIGLAPTGGAPTSAIHPILPFGMSAHGQRWANPFPARIEARASQVYPRRMCNRYGYNNPLKRLIDEFSDVGPIRWNGLEPNVALDQIRPTDRAPIIRTVDGEATLDMVRWGIVPNTWRGPVKAWTAQLRGNPLTNARAESVATTSTFRDAYAARRCLVPATNYFEWTSDPERPKGKKLMWRFTAPYQEIFAFPGIWDHAVTADGQLDSFALLTSAPGPDQAPYHNRQPVILERAQWADWLDVRNDMAPSFLGSPAGSIGVERFVETAAPTLL